MTRDYHTREQELAQSVQVRKASLLGLLPPEDRGTVRHEGSAYAETFEDAAREIALLCRADGPCDRYPWDVRRALEDFQAAVNALWLLAIEQGLPYRFAQAYRRKFPGGMPLDEAEAGALFHLRHFVIRYQPGSGASLLTYAMRGMLDKLREDNTQRGAVQMPQKAGRKVNVGEQQVNYEGLVAFDPTAEDGSRQDQNESPRELARAAPVNGDELLNNPWPVVDECIDDDRHFDND